MGNLQKYREIIISVALFLIFDLSVLVVSSLTTGQLKDDAVAVNLASRQRELSQRIVKTLLQIQIAQSAGQSIEEPQTELAMTFKIFDETIEGLRDGKYVTGGDYQTVMLIPVETDSAKVYLERAFLIWNPFKEKLFRVIAAKRAVPQEDLQDAVEYASKNNLLLLELMNVITSEAEKKLADKSNTLRMIQISGIIAALINFFVLLFHFIRKLRSQDAEIARYSENLEKMVEIRTRELRRAQEQLRATNASLEKAKGELEVLNSQLEQKVEERTAELRNAQTQLIQSEKMAALGQMVAGLAHEVNTPLAFVKTNLEGMREFHKDLFKLVEESEKLCDALQRDDLDRIDEHFARLAEIQRHLKESNRIQDISDMLRESLTGMDRIQELVINLKNFSRLDEAEYKYADIHAGIDSTLLIANNIIKNKAKVIKEYAPKVFAECYPAQLNQVFLNLITNAAQAIEHSNGEIRIKTEVVDGYAVIRVSDNGKGIPKEHLNKIFEPFFTTKPVGQGTGLGLSICYQIIEKHHGSIKVESQVGVGTTFTIKIPTKQTRRDDKVGENVLSPASELQPA
ncbi:MAG: ATP-binding protein [Chloroherpetonaceae bacterium]|nr:ATP-binding protein [Chloroherpetonaceae bacterium]